MLNIVAYELYQNDDGTWDCYTYNPHTGALDDDYTGIGLSSAEAYKDWIGSNNIIVDADGHHTYSIELD